MSSVDSTEVEPFFLLLPLPLRGGPLGPRLRRNGLADTDLIAPFLRSL